MSAQTYMLAPETTILEREPGMLQCGMAVSYTHLTLPTIYSV